MSTLTVDLGPKPLLGQSGSVFEVTAGEWAQVCTYAAQVAEASPAVAARLTVFAPAFPDLRAAAERWAPQTFPGIVSLGRALVAYGGTTVQQDYAQLADILPDLESGKPAQSARSAFQALLQQLQTEASANVAAAAAAAAAVASFASAVQSVETQLAPYVSAPLAAAKGVGAAADPMAQIAAIGRIIAALAGAVLRLQHPPLRELQRIRGGWEAVRSDIDFVGSSVNADISAGKPFIAELNIDVARAGWRQVAGEAEAFVGALAGTH